MQPQLCSRCKKNIAVVFITRQENGQNVNEGLCLKCAKNLGLPQVDEMMRRMGITDEDLDNISNEMMGASTNSSTTTASISPSAHATASSTRSSAARRRSNASSRF